MQRESNSHGLERGLHILAVTSQKLRVAVDHLHIAISSQKANRERTMIDFSELCNFRVLLYVNLRLTVEFPTANHKATVAHPRLGVPRPWQTVILGFLQCINFIFGSLDYVWDLYTFLMDSNYGTYSQRICELNIGLLVV